MVLMKDSVLVVYGGENGAINRAIISLSHSKGENMVIEEASSCGSDGLNAEGKSANSAILQVPARNILLVAVQTFHGEKQSKVLCTQERLRLCERLTSDGTFSSTLLELARLLSKNVRSPYKEGSQCPVR